MPSPLSPQPHLCYRHHGGTLTCSLTSCPRPHLPSPRPAPSSQPNPPSSWSLQQQEISCKPSQLGILRLISGFLPTSPPSSSFRTLASSLHERSPSQAFAGQEAATFLLLPAQGWNGQNVLSWYSLLPLKTTKGGKSLRRLFISSS